MPTVLITGITGQDGSYLAESLLSKGYTVHGLTRRTSAFSRDRIEQLRESGKACGGSFELHDGDFSDFASLNAAVAQTQPDELYNLAAQSHVPVVLDYQSLPRTQTPLIRECLLVLFL